MLPILICMGLSVIGYKVPRLAGWILLATSPFLISLGNWIILIDPLLSLRFNQVLFAASIGVACSESNRKRLALMLPKSSPIYLFFCFITLEVIYGLFQPHETLFKWFMLHQYPAYVAAILLSFSVIRTVEDLNKFREILSFTALLISALCVVELATGFNIAHYLCFSKISYCNLESQHWLPIPTQDGRYFYSADTVVRYVGFTGEPNKTAILLAMFLILFLGQLLLPEYRNVSIFRKSVYFFLLVLGFIVLVLSQVRAAIGAFVLVVVLLSFVNKKVLLLLLYSFFAICIILIFSFDAQSWLIEFIKNRLDAAEIIDDQRRQGFYKSFELFFEYLAFGIGGTIFSVSENYLNSDDVSAYLLYFVAGGISLGLAYIVFLGSMILNLFMLMSSVIKEQKSLILLFISSILIGMITQIFNENAIIFYYLLLYSTCRSADFSYKKFNHEPLAKIKIQNS